MKSELRKCLDGELFNSAAPELLAIIHRARKLTQRYNATASTDAAERRQILMECVGAIGDNVHVDTPFHCDYGRHIRIGNNVIVGMNCTFVDCNTITIGDNVMIASNVQIYTSTHPVAPQERLVEDWTPDCGHPYFRTYALPVVIEDNVWIGGGVVILPGVTIGKNSVIGAGSVVTRSIPADSVAVGNPCRVIRGVTD